MSESKKKAIPDTKKRCAEAKKITNKKIQLRLDKKFH